MLIISEQFHASDRGRQRQGNEDNFFVRSPLFVVADGMGGAQAGEVASQMAVDSFDQGLPDGTPAEGLTQLVEAANRAIHERSQSDAQRAGMGTTVTAAYVGEEDVTIAHVGDSRAYLLRDGDLIRLTRDHSLVGELVERGKLTEEQAETHPQRSVITRALGPEPDVAVDVKAYHARGGDRFLLCSDGLTSMIPEARVKQILEGTEALEEAGRELIAAANDAGGRDNITVLLFRLEEVAAATGSEAGETAEVEAVSEHQGAATMTLPAVSETEAPPKRPAEPIAEAPPPAAEPPRNPPPPGSRRADRLDRRGGDRRRRAVDCLARGLLRGRRRREPGRDDLPRAALRAAVRPGAVRHVLPLRRQPRPGAGRAPRHVHRPQAAVEGRRRRPRAAARKRRNRMTRPTVRR